MDVLPDASLAPDLQLEADDVDGERGDVKATYADTRALAKAVGFAPSTPLESGLARFAEWFRSYYRR